MFCGKMQFRHQEGEKSDGERTQNRFFDIHADQRMHGPVPLLYGALSVRSVNDPLFYAFFPRFCFRNEAAVNRMAEGD